MITLPLVVCAAALLQTSEPIQQVDWKLERTDRVGEYSVRLVGAPRVIETPRGKAIEFNGKGDALFLDTNPLFGLKVFTAEIIFLPYANGSKEQRFFHMQETGTQNRLLFETRLTPDNRWFLDTFIKSGDGNYTLFADKSIHPIDAWYHAAVTMDGKTMRHFVNHKEELSVPVEYTPHQPGTTSIGVRINQVDWFKGAIRRIRITNRVLMISDFLTP